MELRQLQTFVQAAKFQSFSRAATKLGYSQSAVTVQIRLLEKELGTRLFDRMGKQVELTASGRNFLEHANIILYEVDRTRLSMHEDEELKNPLHIGTIESLCTAKFPAIVSQFRKNHHKVKFQITVETPEELIRMMEHDLLDMIYILDAPRWNENWVKAMETAEPVVFVAAPSFWEEEEHHYFQERELLTYSGESGQILGYRIQKTLDEIVQKPFFLTEKNANYRQALDQYLASRHCSLSPALEISDTAFIIQMIEQGHGLSFLPLFAVQKQLEEGKLVVIDVDDVKISMYRQIFYHKNKFKTREMDQFIAYASDEMV